MKLGAIFALPCLAACAAGLGDELGEVKVCRSLAGAPDVYARIGWKEIDPIFGEIVHVSIRPVGGADQRQISHAAFTPEAMAACGQDATGAFGDADTTFADRYREWRARFEAGTAGVFDISPADAFAALLAATEAPSS